MAKKLGHEVRKVVRRAISVARARTLAETEKRAEAEAPAVDREALPAGDSVSDRASRCMTVASPTRLSSAAAVMHLIVIEGGRREARGEEEPCLPASIRSSREGTAREIKLVLVT